MTQRGVRSLLVAEILWVIGYAPLPVFSPLRAGSARLDPGIASLWLAAFAVGAGAVMGATSSCGASISTSRYCPSASRSWDSASWAPLPRQASWASAVAAAAAVGFG